MTYPSVNYDLTYAGDPVSFAIPAGSDLSLTTIAGSGDLTGVLDLYAGSAISVQGVLKDNESDSTIFNRVVNVYYNNTFVGSDTTDANGEYTVEFTLPAMTGNTTVYAMFSAGNFSDVSNAISIQVTTPIGLGDLFSELLPWIIGIIVGLVAVIAVYIVVRRVGKKEGEEKMMLGKGARALVNLEMIKGKLAALQEGSRFREAIIYAYHQFLQILQSFYGVSKRPGQTAREFAMDIVKRAKLPPTVIYPFTSLFEEARFGLPEVTPAKFNEAFQLLLNLFNILQTAPVPALAPTQPELGPN